MAYGSWVSCTRHGLLPDAPRARKPVQRRPHAASPTSTRKLPRDVLARHRALARRQSARWRAGRCTGARVEEGQDEPTLVPWDAWGNRIDRSRCRPLWKEAERIAAERASSPPPTSASTASTRACTQFALVYLVEPSWHVYSCPLAMTDGAGRTLRAIGQPGARRSRPAAADVARSRRARGRAASG